MLGSKCGAMVEEKRTSSRWRAVGIALASHMVIALVAGWVGLRVVTHGIFWSEQPHALSWVVDIASRWDAGWYLPISKLGYASPVDTAFFPLYPLLVAAVHATLRMSYNLSAYVVSLAAFVASLPVVYELARRRYEERTASRAVLLVAMLPGALFSTAL